MLYKGIHMIEQQNDDCINIDEATEYLGVKTFTICS